MPSVDALQIKNFVASGSLCYNKLYKTKEVDSGCCWSANRKSMLTGKQRRFLRAMGNTLEPIVHVGKGGISETVMSQLDEALENRELVKVKVLNNCMQELDEVAKGLEACTGAEIAQIIGHSILFYRQAKEKPQIELPQ
ncbi:MAG: ribosome assembly RNA-binding protein YhbY [Carboxydocellales bacterium]